MSSRGRGPGALGARVRGVLDEAARPSLWWWIGGVILYAALAYAIFTADGGFSVLLLVLFVAVAICPFVLGGQINAYELDDRPPGQRPSVVWHVSNAPGLVAAVVGDEIVLDPTRCRLMARLWTPNTLRLSRRAAYVFDGTPSDDALSANVTAGRRGVLLEFDAAGSRRPVVPTRLRPRVHQRLPRPCPQRDRHDRHDHDEQHDQHDAQSNDDVGGRRAGERSDDDVRTSTTERRAMRIAQLHESARGARVVDVSDGHHPETRAFLTRHDCPHVATPSADLLALDVVDERLIEVKGRGGLGNVTGLAERQLATHRAAGDLAWLYVVFNTTQPRPVELWLVQNPARLSWTETRPATRQAGTPRGVQHEAKYDLELDDVLAAGQRAELPDLEQLPSWCGAFRD